MAVLVLCTGAVSILVAFGSLLGLVLYPLLGSDSRIAFSLFVGIAVRITALPVLARIIQERGLEGTHLGTVAIACAGVNDAIAWLTLAGILGFSHPESGQKTLQQVFVFLLIYLIAVWYGLRNLARRWRPESLTRILIALFSSSLATEWIGLHAFFGAIAAMPKTPVFSRADRGEAWQVGQCELAARGWECPGGNPRCWAS